jgi:PPE-repeat protein
MSFGTLPPETNSGRMYSGPGAGSMIEAATIWDGLAAHLHGMAAAYGAVTAKLACAWQGPAAMAITQAAAPYLAWLNATGAQAQQTATHAKAAASAYDSAFAAMLPPQVIEANRARRILLASANCLGQASPAIAGIEADYEQMWAHDADAMYAYARASADASALTKFSSPPSATGPAGSARHGVTSTSGGWALTAAPEVISAGNQLMSTIPEALEALSVSPLISFDVSLSPVTPSLSKLSSLSAPRDIAISRLNSLNKAAVLGNAAALHALIPNVGRASGAGSTRSFGRGISIGTLSVPPAWATATTPPPVTVEPSRSGWVCEPIRLVKGSEPPMWPSCS